MLAANGSGRRSIARGPVGGFEATPLVEPRAVQFKSSSANVHGLLYRPIATRPPLVVHLHGGPTGQALADWNARVQWLVARGCAVLQPNYRGSSGYGRAYTQALAGRWGDRDVADTAAGIRHAVKEGWCDPNRIVLMGGSAGGFTALLVAAKHPDLVHGVIALYPVTDLLDLAATTHRFESGYHLRLVGPLPDAADRYRERSPLTLAGEIRATGPPAARVRRSIRAPRAVGAPRGAARGLRTARVRRRGARLAPGRDRRRRARAHRRLPHAHAVTARADAAEAVEGPRPGAE